MHAYVSTPALADRRPRPPRAADLCIAVAAVDAATTNASVSTLFGADPELAYVPVVVDDRPVGMIKRHVFFSEMAKPFHRELYERKACDAFMDREPLVIDSDTSIEDTASLVVASGGKALTDGFLIVRDGRYLGVGTGLDLMRLVASLQAARSRQVMQSIDYASTIQRAMLSPSSDALQRALPDAALVWQPRDVVGGDFYFVMDYPEGCFVLLADCTGHGVPGAFMTLISSSWIARALERHGPSDPGRALSEVNRSIKQSLAQTEKRRIGEGSDDGLDAIAIWFERAQARMTFASARTPLYLLAPGDDAVTMIAGDRMGIGYVDSPVNHVWRNHGVDLVDGTIVCVATDGVTDQIGGPRTIGFGKRRLREAMLAGRDLPMDAFAEHIVAAHSAYEVGHARRDDLTLLAIRL